VACRHVRGGSRRRRARIGDAVGDADGAEAAAREKDARQFGEPVVDRGHALKVSHFVLRALTRPSKESSDHGIPGNAKQALELTAKTAGDVFPPESKTGPTRESIAAWLESLTAIAEAGLTPKDIDGIIPIGITGAPAEEFVTFAVTYPYDFQLPFTFLYL